MPAQKADPNDTTERFENAVKYGETVRCLRKNGLEAWNNFKADLPAIPIRWKPGTQEIYQKLRQLGVTGEDTDVKTDNWERHHFLLQLGRIIKNNPEGSYLRLMQIAYNIGQLEAEIRKSEAYTDEMKQFYDNNELAFIETYVDFDNQ